jgi:hypothetical protein
MNSKLLHDWINEFASELMAIEAGENSSEYNFDQIDCELLLAALRSYRSTGSGDHHVLIDGKLYRPI